jgi:transcriptional regulator GlxA family with amidase domain
VRLSLYCDADFRNFRGKIDTLLAPGGIGVEEGKPDAAAVRWLQQAAAQSRRVGSICTGAFLLAHAGLLDGRRVATHWAFAAELAKRYPKVSVDPEAIWAQDDNFYTSAGFYHKPETTWGTMNDDVLALLDPKFKRANFCSIILNSAWQR